MHKKINPLVHLHQSNIIEYKNKDLYLKWIELYDTISETDREYMQQKSNVFTYRPLISVIMPVYNSSIEFLELAIQSVLKQIYPYWELCIADDASTQIEVKNILELYAKKDARIKVVYRRSNGNISLASNSALELATGEFLALFDHDDELSENALYKVVEELNKHPDAVLIYSDEDHISQEGKRAHPYLKSDWNPELIYGHNFISHLGVYKHSLVKQLGGFRTGFEGSQDYDLALRVIERAQEHQIRYIPYVLYHWRRVAESVSNSNIEKCQLAARKAIQDHLDRLNISGAKVAANPLIPEVYRVIYPVPEKPPLVSIVIPSKDKLELLRACIQSIVQKTDYPNYEILIVSNNSKNAKTFAFFNSMKHFKNIKIIEYNVPFNYSKINNFAAKQTKGDVLLFLNNDTEVLDSSWLNEIVSHAVRPGIGIVGAKLYYADDTIQHAGIIAGLNTLVGHVFSKVSNKNYGYMGKAALCQNFLAVTGACMAMRREVFDALEGFEENNLKIAFNDVDLCFRAYSKGYKIVWTPFAELYHYESRTRGRPETDTEIEQEEHEIQYMRHTWEHLLKNDPYFNPCLSLSCGNYSLAFPARRAWP